MKPRPGSGGVWGGAAPKQGKSIAGKDGEGFRYSDLRPGLSLRQDGAARGDRQFDRAQGGLAQGAGGAIVMMMAGLPRGRGKGNDVYPGGLAGQVGAAGTPAGLGGQLPLVGQGQEKIGQKSQQAKKGLPPRGCQAAWVHDRRIIPFSCRGGPRCAPQAGGHASLPLQFVVFQGETDIIPLVLSDK